MSPMLGNAVERGNPSDWPKYRILRDAWLLAHAKPFSRYLIQAVLLACLAVLINIVFPLLNRAIVNEGILANQRSFIILAICVQLLLYLVLIAINLARSSLGSQISNRVLARMNGEYISHIARLPMSFFQSARGGELIERMRDLERVQRFSSVELVNAIAGLISIASLSVLLAWIDLSIFLAFLLSALAYMAWITLVGRYRRALDQRRFSEAARSRVSEIGMLEAIQDIKIAGYEEIALARWASLQVERLNSSLACARIENIQAAGGQVFNRSGMLLLTLIAAYKSAHGAITLGDFMIVLTIGLQMYFYVNQLLDFSNSLDDVRAALKRAASVRLLEAEGGRRSDKAASPSMKIGLSFREVSLSYPGTIRRSLEGLSFISTVGSMTALVGPSGSGKSSILKLLLGLYEPSRGTIMIDETPLSLIDQALWRSKIGAVMQGGSMFDATIRENIIGAESLNGDWLDRVIVASCLEDVISKMPDGLDTPVGPSCQRLSAGQMQRILIARALYKRPTLLLFDEATSALDGNNEAAIIGNIKALLPGVTSIVAAHRLNTIVDADQILVVDDGRIASRGSPAEVLDSSFLLGSLASSRV